MCLRDAAWPYLLGINDRLARTLQFLQCLATSKLRWVCEWEERLLLWSLSPSCVFSRILSEERISRIEELGPSKRPDV